jgi:hypothetical protein
LATGSALLVAGGGLLALAPSASAAIVPGSATALAAALDGPGANITGASYLNLANAGQNGVGDSTLSNFPRNGPTFAIMTSGFATSADDTNTNVPDSASANDDKTGDLNGVNARGNTDFDVSVLKVDLSVPATANCLSFDFQFYTEEYADFVGQQFNDAFIAELDTTSWDTSGSAINAPDNFAFAPGGAVVSVNAVGIGGFSLANAAGTTYDGATPLLSAAKQVTPGAHSLYLSIFDQGDQILDSAAFIDNLRVGFVPDPATQCVPGAQVKQFQLDLSPANATLDTGQQHTVTATLQDLNATPPALEGADVLFEVTGANPGTGAGTTNAAGQTTFSYTGHNVGNDTISACYDVDASGTCDSGEPFASAQATWTNSPPTNEAGGPYAGDEGTAVVLAGSAGDVNAGDTLTNSWSYAPVSGVDSGASCAFADPTDLSTTVTCTDDGTYELTLTTSDGVNPDVTDSAELVIGNVAPEIESITTPVAPVLITTPVSMSATYSDPGGNDTHTATVDWGDGTTSAPVASGGSLSDSHTYGSAGIFTICVTVTDDDGGSDTECAENPVVVYDPSAGFVTGGGWISAAPGSVPADPSASGPGRFGFVAKYKKGATVPDGSTEFQSQSGDLNFHSTSYQWLVVAGSQATYKGTGTVNGDDGYSFLVSTVDGGKNGPDKFRIKIWETGSGTVVFDNQTGGADGDPAVNPITQGSIVIHG